MHFLWDLCHSVTLHLILVCGSVMWYMSHSRTYIKERIIKCSIELILLLQPLEEKNTEHSEELH